VRGHQRRLGGLCARGSNLGRTRPQGNDLTAIVYRRTRSSHVSGLNARPCCAEASAYRPRVLLHTLRRAACQECCLLVPSMLLLLQLLYPLPIIDPPNFTKYVHELHNPMRAMESSALCSRKPGSEPHLRLVPPQNLRFSAPKERHITVRASLRGAFIISGYKSLSSTLGRTPVSCGALCFSLLILAQQRLGDLTRTTYLMKNIPPGHGKQRYAELNSVQLQFEFLKSHIGTSPPVDTYLGSAYAAGGKDFFDAHIL